MKQPEMGMEAELEPKLTVELGLGLVVGLKIKMKKVQVLAAKGPMQEPQALQSVEDLR